MHFRSSSESSLDLVPLGPECRTWWLRAGTSELVPEGPTPSGRPDIGGHARCGTCVFRATVPLSCTEAHNYASFLKEDGGMLPRPLPPAAASPWCLSSVARFGSPAFSATRDGIPGLRAPGAGSVR